MTRKQFDILDILIDSTARISQRELSERTGISLGSVNTVLKELDEAGLVSSNRITPKGVEAMQPYKVKRAVIIAAGFGSRMIPITLNTPKPLVRVKGNRIIDSLLDALKEAEIEEIYVIRGYLAEQFDHVGILHEIAGTDDGREVIGFIVHRVLDELDIRILIQ